MRIKGCNNEPVFGSLSALIYQHSLTALALPTKLLLPECDVLGPAAAAAAASVPTPAARTQRSLALDAACNVLYLFTMDTESLTGPQVCSGALHSICLIHSVPFVCSMLVMLTFWTLCVGIGLE